MNTIAYTVSNNLYLNITNACTNNCDFCIRKKTARFNQEYALWLDHEPSYEEIIASLPDLSRFGQIVFCGYGEPLVRVEMVTQVARYLKEKGCYVRLNTNGQANLIHRRNIVPDLVGLIDAVSVSLNAHNAEIYQAMCHSSFGTEAFSAMLEFTRQCKEHLPSTQLSVVALPEVDLDKCREIADSIGVPLRVREYYEEEYSGFRP